MSGLLGNKSKSQAAQTPAYTSLSIQTSVSGKCIPLLWGRQRLAPNLIWYGDFQATAQKDSSASSGKGGSSSSNGTTTYTYSASIMFALCEGPVQSVQTVWKDKEVHTPEDLGMGLLSGADGQQSWDWLSSHHADMALSYRGTAIEVVANYSLGSAASLPTHNFLVVGKYSQQYNGIYDVDPSLILVDFLTNPGYGVGFPAASIGDLSQWQRYCLVNFLMLSPLWEQQQSASSYIQQLMLLTNSNCFWSQGQLKIVPYGDAPGSSYGTTFTPNLTPVYDLNDADFQGDSGDDPVLVDRSSPADAINHVSLEWTNAANSFQTEPIEWKDQAAIEAFGERKNSSLTAHEVTSLTTATSIVALLGQRGLYVRNSFRFKLGWQYCLLEPMDIVTLTDANLGLAKFPVRITSIEQQDDDTLQIVAEEFPAAIGTATLYPKSTVGGFTPNYNIAPGHVNVPVIFEPPPQLTGGAPEVWIGASGGAYWGGCDVWISHDDLTYLNVGRVSAPVRQGVLTAPLAAHADPDGANTLAVDLGESSGALVTVTQADADAFNTLCFVDNELIGFETATLTGSHQYALTNLRRGVYGSAIATHNAGTQLCRLDGAIFKYPLPPAYVGVPLHVKFTSFNIYGTAEESLADVAAYGLTPTGASSYIAAPSNVLVSFGSRIQDDGTAIMTMVGAWAASSGPLLDQYEAQWKLHSATSWQSVIVGGNATDAVIYPVQENQSFDFRVRAISTLPAYSAWATAGTAASGALDPTVPDAPTNLTAIPGYRQITLAWTASGSRNVAAYRIFESLDNNFANAGQVNQIDADTWTRSGLGLGDPRWYWIEAISKSGVPSSVVGPAGATSSFVFPAADLGAAAISESQLVTDLTARIDLIDAPAAVAGSVSARVAAESNTRMAADMAAAQMLQAISAAVDTATGTALAAISTESKTRASATENLASQITQVSSTLGSNTATVQALQQSVNGISAEYSIKTDIDVNGVHYVAGFGLLSGPDGDGGVSSEFAVLANKFTIAQLNADGSVSKVAPFFVQNGVVYIQSALIGSLAANKITSGDITGQLVRIFGGLQVYDTSNNLILNVDGLGVNIVKTANIVSGAVTNGGAAAGAQGASVPVNTWTTLLAFSLTVTGRFTPIFFSADIPMQTTTTGPSGDAGNYYTYTSVAALRLVINGAQVATSSPYVWQGGAGTLTLSLQAIAYGEGDNGANDGPLTCNYASLVATDYKV